MNQILDPHHFAFSLLFEHPLPSAKRNSSSTSVCTLDLACNLLRLKSFPSKRYLRGIPLSPSLKASVSMAENIMLNSVEASTQPCLSPFVTGNGSENSPSFWTLARISSWNWCYEFGGIAKLCHNFPKSLTTDCVKCSCRGPHSVPGIFLKLSCCKDHVCCSSVFPESTLAFW